MKERPLLNDMQQIWRENGTWFGLDSQYQVFKMVRQRTENGVWDIWVYDDEAMPLVCGVEA